jgi:phage replication-related protein YjqB (UPF0714/DUF867 family)
VISLGSQCLSCLGVEKSLLRKVSACVCPAYYDFTRTLKSADGSVLDLPVSARFPGFNEAETLGVIERVSYFLVVHGYKMSLLKVSD